LTCPEVSAFLDWNKKNIICLWGKNHRSARISALLHQLGF